MLTFLFQLLATATCIGYNYLSDLQSGSLLYRIKSPKSDILVYSMYLQLGSLTDGEFSARQYILNVICATTMVFLTQI